MQLLEQALHELINVQAALSRRTLPLSQGLLQHAVELFPGSPAALADCCRSKPILPGWLTPGCTSALH
jgi:hypothetical protein